MQSNYSGLTGMTGMIEMPEVDADAKAQLSEMAKDIFSRYLGHVAESPINLEPTLRDKIYAKFGYHCVNEESFDQDLLFRNIGFGLFTEVLQPVITELVAAYKAFK